MKSVCSVLLLTLSCIGTQETDETVRVVAMDKDFHVDCYHCEVSTSLDYL